MNIAELKLVEGSTQDRNKYMDKTDVLERVKELSLLPNTELVTIRSVADYYEVEMETIKKVIQRHREELETNGMRVESHKNIMSLVNRDNKSPLKISPRGTTLFTRRTVLNIGMLLRDSEVAKQVRSYLLDTERKYKNGMLFELSEEDEEFILKQMYTNINNGMLKMDSFRDIAEKLGLNENQIRNKWYGNSASKGKKLRELFEDETFMMKLLNAEIETNDEFKILESKMETFINNQNKVNKQLLGTVQLLYSTIDNQLLRSINKLHMDINDLKAVIGEETDGKIDDLNQELDKMRKRLTKERKEKDELFKRFGQMAFDSSDKYISKGFEFKMDRNGNLESK